MDPWVWTVDEVVFNLCGADELWKERPNSKLPDPINFEAVLRENNIDGATLLEHVDNGILKNDLGVASLGERAAIIYAVERLRTLSSRYVSHKADIESRQTRITSQAGTLTSTTTPPPSNLVSPAANAAQLVSEEQDLKIDRPVDDGPKPRAGEYIVTEGGVKRRRLVLAPASAPTTPSKTTYGEWSQKTLAELDDPSVQGYLGHSPFFVDKLFYGDSRNGQALDYDSDEGIAEFSILTRPSRSRLRQGEKAFVHRRMQHFLTSVPKPLDQFHSVRYPYPESLATDKAGRSLTLFKASSNNVTAFRKDAALVNLEALDMAGDDTFNAIDSQDVDHSWDHLISKYPDDGVALPLYDESGSENEYSQSLVDEIEANAAADDESRKKKFQNLDISEVLDIVNKEIANFRDIWSQETLPRRQRNARTIWSKARGRSRRANIIVATKFRVEQLDARLQKLVDEVCSEQWRNATPLRKQCAIFRQTVEDQEDCNWKLKLWENARPSPNEAQARPKQMTIVKNLEAIEHSESGESLESESDDAEDFIDIDTMAYDLPDDSSHSREDIPRSPSTSQSPSQWIQRAESEDSVIGRQDHWAVKAPKLPTVAPSQDVIDLTSPPPSSPLVPPMDDLFDVEEVDTAENATHAEVESWDWRDLDEQSDRKRIIRKHLQAMDNALRNKVQLYFVENGLSKLKNDVRRGLRALKRKTKFIQETESRHLATVFAISRLFVCWNDGDHRHFDRSRDVDIADPALTSALQTKNFEDFYAFVKSISAVANASDSEGETEDTPRKGRKNKVLMDHSARALRNNAHARRVEGEVRSLKLKLTLGSSNLTEQRDYGVIINTNKKETEELICLNPHIGDKVKPHQVEGIRFLWREVVSVGQTSTASMQGCLLAHTMGLGKTMQTIALLVTIAEAAASANEGIRGQIPASLQTSRTLILCPAGLIENWIDEFRQWIPSGNHPIGPVIDLSAKETVNQRLAIIFKWYADGGILLMGYEMFQKFALNKFKRPGLSSDDVYDRAKEHLLNGPNIVVADEAHKLKSATSSINRAAHLFRTQSRIALTGSPLANNLQDYYQMLDWVAPGYLGKIVEFKAHYQEPIEAGTYADSTVNEQRRSLMKLKALIREIEPKVNRADISVIQNDLKAKTEFVIKLPLTEWQMKAYTAFVRSIWSKSAEGEDIVGAKMFDWIHFLALLCTQPSIFLRSLRKRASEKRGTKKSMPEQLEDELIDDASNDDADSTVEVSANMVAEQEQIVRDLGINQIDDSASAFKIRVIGEILVQSKLVGDQVLIFAQHLHTLDYLERFIKTLPGGMRTTRLDGSTKTDTRADVVKRFNAGKFDVFLISTRAGGLGLNIDGANRVILVDFSFNPSHEEQAVGRAYRIGQRKQVFVYHLVTAGTYEETLHNTTIFKKQLAARVVDQKKPTRSASKEATYLFEPKDVEQEADLAEFRGKDHIMDYLLDGDAGSFIRGIKTAETMHKETHEELTAAEEEEVEQFVGDQGRKRELDALARSQGHSAASQSPSTISKGKSKMHKDTIVDLTAAPEEEVQQFIGDQWRKREDVLARIQGHGHSAVSQSGAHDVEKPAGGISRSVHDISQQRPSAKPDDDS